MKDNLLDYLIATDSIDEFLGNEKDEEEPEDDLFIDEDEDEDEED